MREFVVSIANSTVANAAVTLAFINPASAPNPSIEFMRYWIGQTGNLTNAQQRCQIVTQVSSFPTLASFTPKKLKPADPNASVITGNTSGPQGSAGINATAENGGTKTIVWEDAFSTINGWLLVPTPEERLELAPNVSATASGMGLHFPTAPGTLTGWTWGSVYRELG